MRRLVSVWLPDWPVTAWSRRAGRHSPPREQPPEDQPFALIDKGVHGLVIHASLAGALLSLASQRVGGP